MSKPEQIDTLNADGAGSVGSAAALGVAANTLRRILRIQNRHATQILYVGKDNTVSASVFNWVLTGTTANPANELNLDGYTGAIWVFGSGAATLYTILEADGYSPSY